MYSELKDDFNDRVVWRARLRKPSLILSIQNQNYYCMSLQLTIELVIVDEAIGGAVVGLDFLLTFEFGQDLLGELLAELDAPLVKRVDVPNSALREDLHFVHGNETAERSRSELLEHERV